MCAREKIKSNSLVELLSHGADGEMYGACASRALNASDASSWHYLRLSLITDEGHMHWSDYFFYSRTLACSWTETGSPDMMSL